MNVDPFDPLSDPGVQRLDQAQSEEERQRIEAELLEPTDNGWQDGDPEEQPPQGVADGQG